MSLKSGSYRTNIKKLDEVETLLTEVRNEIGTLDLSAVAHQVETNKANIEILDISVNDLETRVNALDISVSIIEVIDASINLLDGRVEQNEADISTLETSKQDTITNLVADGLLSTGSNITATQNGIDTQLNVDLSSKQDVITNLVSDNFLTAGTSISFSQNGTNTTINASGSDPVHFQCAFNGNFVNITSGNYLNANAIVFQEPNTGTLVSTNGGFAYTIQETGVYELGYNMNMNENPTLASVEIGLVYVRNSAETIISRGGIYMGFIQGHSILAELQQGDLVAVKYISGNAGAITYYGSQVLPAEIKSWFYGHKIG